jgi:hypothetical protein
MKVTFRKWDRLTGLAGVGYPHQSVDIKINKKKIGTIYAPNWQTEDNKWSVAFMVMKEPEDSNPNNKWKWIYMKARFENEETAREFVTKIVDKVAEKYTFHYLD